MTNDLIQGLRTHAFDDCGETFLATHICNIAADRITTLEAENAALREALTTIAARNFNCSAHQDGMAAAGLAERTLLSLPTQGTTDKEPVS